MMLISAVLLSLLVVAPATALQVTPHSPCTDRCGANVGRMTPDEIVCFDQDFGAHGTHNGSVFEDCVSCELESTFNDQITFQSDVYWGLFNLRYAWSVCVLGFPAQVIGLSNQCLASCTQFNSSVESRLLDPISGEMYQWCNTLSDPDVTACASCLNLTDNERLMGNFIQATRGSCHEQTPLGSKFAISPSSIFTPAPLPVSTGGFHPHHPLSQGALIAAIVVPIVVVFIACALGTCACFYLLHRRSMRSRRRAGPFALWDDPDADRKPALALAEDAMPEWERSVEESGQAPWQWPWPWMGWQDQHPGAGQTMPMGPMSEFPVPFTDDYEGEERGREDSERPPVTAEGAAATTPVQFPRVG